MLRLVADWERANHLIDEGEHGDLAWTQAALYVGMLDWAEVAEREDGDDSYYQWIRRIGRRNSWQTGKMMYHADDIAVSQAWLTMYAKYRERNMLLPTLARTEFVLRYPSCSTLELDYTDGATLERWSWCDALFMAPPVYARMYVLTGRPEFLEFMDREYKATYEYLYDKEARLFYRDWRYFERREGLLGPRQRLGIRRPCGAAADSPGDKRLQGFLRGPFCGPGRETGRASES